MNDLLQKATISLAIYLEKTLPPLCDDWWKEAVLDMLSTRQRKMVEKRSIDSLASLDLAALLRVLDNNWFRISQERSLTSEDRNYAKEMITVRNRWAHASSEGFSDDDLYRDLDTLQRFASLIEADEDLIQELQSSKTALLRISAPGSVTSDASRDTLLSSTKQPSAKFSLGEMVELVSDPDTKGAIVSVVQGYPEDRYSVFLDGSIQTYYASQLQSETPREDRTQLLTCDEFHSYMTALQIKYPGLSTLYSLNAARVDFIPYQFRPVLKFIRSDRPRLLIADGVGVGKTIEAGLILREIQARRDIQSILIICPRPLVTERKWQLEMKRFGERFTHLNGRELRYCINETHDEGVWPEQHMRTIIPYSLLNEGLLQGTNGKRNKGFLDLDPPPRFDLVIVDEAHHIRNQTTANNKAVRFFCDNAEAVVFLTATPIQLGSHDLFVLLNTLRPDLVLDNESFVHMSEPNPFINQAISLARTQVEGWTKQASISLNQAAATAWGRSILSHNPDFDRIQESLSDESLNPEQRVQLITDLEGLHTFAGIINRTRRRDIGDFTIRKTETRRVDFTPSQKEIHDELLRVQAEILSSLYENVNLKFLMSMIRRQAASCIFGLVPHLEEILNRRLDELGIEEADFDADLPQIGCIDEIEPQISNLLEKVKNIDSRDTKLEVLRKVIREKQELPNNKVMLFSTFRHTLRYLYKHLKEDGFRVGMIHGDVPDEERIELRDRFELSKEKVKALDILLFSEIGCEGLDYQFCDCITNYDLPWNPMRIEQRIGRIDRWGQKSDTVAIVNLITPGTIDAEIYERCLMRIGVFNSALGGSEEILGDITKEITSIAENFTISEEERKEKLQQLADNKIRLIQEQEELEQKQHELFGIRLPQKQIEREIDQASSYWLSAFSIQRLVSNYLEGVAGKEQEFILGEKELKTLRLSGENRLRLLHDFGKLKQQRNDMYRDWELWLKGGEPHLQITFESHCATKHPEATFVIPTHPLVKQAASALDTSKRFFTSLKVISHEVPSGKYDFAIYQWQFHGIKEDLVITPVALTESVTQLLLRLLETAVDDPEKGVDIADPTVLENLDTKHHSLWSIARSKHQQRTRELSEFRRESLTTSHRARMALLEEQLSQVTNEKIRTMRQGQISRAENDYAKRVQDLDIAMERAEVTAGAVAYGVIRVMEYDDEK